MKQLSKLALIFPFLLFNLHSEETEDIDLEGSLVIIAGQGAAQRVGSWRSHFQQSLSTFTCFIRGGGSDMYNFVLREGSML